MLSIADLKHIVSAAPVVPVLTIDDASRAAELAVAFARVGIGAVEVTLRTEAALESLALMKAAAPGMLVGAGTILGEGDLDAATKAGADFFVSPGLPSSLRDAVTASGVPFIPGVATPTEAMERSDEGFDLVKLFPAEVVGGLSMLKAMSGPLPHIKFMPTGGITIDNLEDYLRLPNVVCVGGTWIARPNDIASGDMTTISRRAKDALSKATR